MEMWLETGGDWSPHYLVYRRKGFWDSAQDSEQQLFTNNIKFVSQIKTYWEWKVHLNFQNDSVVYHLSV